MILDYLKRTILCISGLFIAGIGCYIVIQATNVGFGGWETLQTGLSMKTGVPYGTVNVCVGLCIIVLDFFLGAKIGPGTIMNACLVGSFINVFSSFNLMGPATSIPQGLFFILLGFAVNGVGTVLYMKAAMGCGPRDSLMVVLGKKFPKAPIGIVRFCIDSTALVVGIVLGAPFGIGTVFAVTSFSTILQTVFKILHFNSRAVQHESFGDIIKKFKEAQ